VKTGYLPDKKYFLILLCATLAGCNQSSRPEPLTPDSMPERPRIVTLSPHLAELVFSIGAGDLVVGVSAYTDYPEDAARLPVIGDAFNVDQEQLALLRPDLLLSWDTGTPAHVVDELRSRGFRVEVIGTTALADLPQALNRLGDLTGHKDDAAEVAARFSRGLAELARAYDAAEPIRVFYQVDAHPLYTINGDHYLSELVQICGGTNIFEDLVGLAPLISVESVLEREPEVILASTDAGEQAFVEWHRWPDLAAMKYGNYFLMPANEIGRATLRLLVGARAVCDALEEGRKNRAGLRND
jgi:iron complex transport system substrate-binding protein